MDMLSKSEREAGYRPVPQPTEGEVAVLRRVASGFLLRTETEVGPRYTYDDGSPISRIRRRQDDDAMVKRMVARGLLIPITGETLLDSEDQPPQRYRARTPDDGPLPKFVRK